MSGAFQQVTTLLGKSDAISYMKSLVRSHQFPEKRREALQFLKVILKQDQEALRASSQEHVSHQTDFDEIRYVTINSRQPDSAAHHTRALTSPRQHTVHYVSLRTRARSITLGPKSAVEDRGKNY